MAEPSLIVEARVAEHMERYEDMAECMKVFVETESKGLLTVDQRNLLSVAYKNVIGTRRNSWRVLLSISKKEFDEAILNKFKKKIKAELDKICDEVFGLLQLLLDPVSNNENSENKEAADEAFIFYQKMRGDYYRYLCEVDEDKTKHTENSKEAYMKAYDKAKETLVSTHPIRLGLALNFSVFYYEIGGEPTKACDLARKAFDDAITEMESISSEDSYKDSSLILQLLRDNLTLWTQDDQEDQEDPTEQD